MAAGSTRDTRSPSRTTQPLSLPPSATVLPRDARSSLGANLMYVSIAPTDVKIPNLPSGFKPLIRPIEGCTGVHVSMRCSKRKESSADANGWPVSCASWSWRHVGLGIGRKPPTVTPTHGWPRTAWIGILRPCALMRNGLAISRRFGRMRAGSTLRLCLIYSHVG